MHSLTKRIIRRIKYLGLKNVKIYFIFQRIFRINSHVKWPVHWSSIVVRPEKIIRKMYRPCPGDMPGCYIQALNGIEIGRNVRIAAGVKIISANHDVDDFEKHVKSEPVIIGDNCWLSANCVILPGVKIGNHTIVAAGAVVTKSFEEGNCILGGVPAKVVKKLGDYKGKSEL